MFFLYINFRNNLCDLRWKHERSERVLGRSRPSVSPQSCARYAENDRYDNSHVKNETRRNGGKRWKTGNRRPALRHRPFGLLEIARGRRLIIVFLAAGPVGKPAAEKCCYRKRSRVAVGRVVRYLAPACCPRAVNILIPRRAEFSPRER